MYPLLQSFSRLTAVSNLPITSVDLCYREGLLSGAKGERNRRFAERNYQSGRQCCSWGEALWKAKQNLQYHV